MRRYNSPSLWRKRRRQQEFRRIWETVDNGLYAVTLLKAHHDNDITIEIDESQIGENLGSCIRLIKSLKKASTDPSLAERSHVNIVDGLELSAENLERIQSEMQKSKDEMKPISDLFVEDKLREIEQYAQGYAVK